MLALATIVTVIMEILLRFFRRRNRHLRHMLELVYEKHIAPQIIDATDGIRQEADRAAKVAQKAAKKASKARAKDTQRQEREVDTELAELKRRLNR